MKTYTIRLDNQFFELLENLSKKTRSPKSLVVKKALLLYKREIEKQEMLKNLLESAKELAEDPQNLKDIEELEGTISDGIS
ncbi:ribbon-helix-helix domain-containing protein [Phorcysia thermohydrogeniphila]|uniref:Ribbon-helix-helix protein n=1 Tax=Phorcysia thermohydrogeniphila TaxID=936138 RepID=A0A4R1G8D5_9BACT|nr:ribbon-helix-helix domain-containing protein [Phorcysia thermohydrogeniphila]TCK02921.1 ribbon-helix-helix protein [Phorcysia thermohydrogeniphila]